MDRRFFSCVANMVLLPTPLKAFTDTMPDVKAMLRICARNLYGWPNGQAEFHDTNTELDKWCDWASYPQSWPRTLNERLPLGIVPLSPSIRTCAKKRIATIRDEVRFGLAYWGITL
jgi:hypothetical protein